MFTATPGYVMVGGDFSQQEPRLLAEYSNDSNMIQAYKDGKDLYATIAAGVYKNDYWDNMEHHQDGTANPEGKKRRGNCKSILLGIMYGRGNASIASQIGCSLQEANKIIEDFYASFPNVKLWIDNTTESAHKLGYVEDFWGRKRRLPDILKKPFDVIDKNDKLSTDINPLLGSKGLITKTINPRVVYYTEQLKNANGYRQINVLKEQAAKENILIHDNNGFIAQAERQAVNSRVQGGAATMSKLAMIAVHNNQQLKDLGFRMLLQVHDELIGECPKENADKVAELLSSIMKHSAEPVVSIPFKTDTYQVNAWYEDDFGDIVREQYKKFISDGKLENDARHAIMDMYSELTEQQVDNFLINC